MNNRLTIQEMAGLLAEYTGKDKKETERFLRVFVSVVMEGVFTNKSVKIKGLGTFKVVAVEKRESIHVNTGERFLIPEHYKFSFLPDKELKDLVNKPFSFFDTAEVNGNADFSDIDLTEEDMDKETEDESVEEVFREEKTVNKESVDNHIESITDIPQEDNTQVEAFQESLLDDITRPEDNEVSEPKDVIEPKEEIIAESIRGIEPKDEVVTESKDVVELKEEVASDLKEEVDTELRDVIEPKEELLVESKVVAASKDEVVSEPKEEEIMESKVVSEPKEEVVSELKEENIEPRDIAEPQKEETPVAEQKEIQYTDFFQNDVMRNDYGITNYSLLRRIVITLSAFVFVGIIGFYFFFDLKSLILYNSGDDEVIIKIGNENVNNAMPVDSSDMVIEDNENRLDTTNTIVPKEELVGEESTKAIKPQEQQAITQPAKGALAKVRIKSGDRLTLIALEYYGHKIFWVYLYEHNKEAIGDPNNVSIGTEITIPNPELYGIDAHNRESIEKASALQTQILSGEK